MESEIQRAVTARDKNVALGAMPELAKAFADELNAIDLLAANRPERIRDLRRRMDAACDVGDLSIREWRTLIEKVAAARAEAPLARTGRPTA